METRRVSTEYERIARDLIETEPLLEPLKRSDVSICYLASDREKTSRRRTVFAECERVPDKWRWACPHDFTVTVFEPNAERLGDERLRILMLHELMHVGVERDGNEESCFLRPHDVEDFRAILERHGLGWSE